MSKRVMWLVVPVVALLAVVALGSPAAAVVTVQRAEINNGQLRLEGTATANRDVAVDGVVMGRSGSDGRFRIERSSFSPPADCTVDVNDGSPTAAVARLAGCVAAPSTTTTSTTVTPPPSTIATTTTTTTITTTSVAASTTTTVTPPVTGFRIVTASPLRNANVGTEYTAFIEACCGNGAGPIRWSLVAGRVPAGLRFVGDDFRLTQTTGVVGTPTRTETTTFTVEARDGSGARTRRTFSLTVDPPLPLEITNGGNTLAPGTVGQPYANSLFAFGGVRPWTWSIIGALPPGLTLSGNTISGTPSAAGSYTFTARVRSADGQLAERVFTINISPRA